MHSDKRNNQRDGLLIGDRELLVVLSVEVVLSSERCYRANVTSRVHHNLARGLHIFLVLVDSAGDCLSLYDSGKYDEGYQAQDNQSEQPGIDKCNDYTKDETRHRLNEYANSTTSGLYRE